MIADELRLQADEFIDLKHLESKIGRSVSAIREAGRGLAQPRTKQSKSSYRPIVMPEAEISSARVLAS
jgi:hypothetical protein